MRNGVHCSKHRCREVASWSKAHKTPTDWSAEAQLKDLGFKELPDFMSRRVLALDVALQLEGLRRLFEKTLQL